ncbi:hypothetical protein MRBBS_2994 [Marinobacter sp. BSs20148]|nr:hypothetical protein MRBBS_2994 [Marinobacter sp. BSs20148]
MVPHGSLRAFWLSYMTTPAMGDIWKNGGGVVVTGRLVPG